MLFFEIMACMEWSKLPSSMGICAPSDDLKMMTAFLSAKSDMQAYERKQEEIKAELNSRTPKAAMPSRLPHVGFRR